MEKIVRKTLPHLLPSWIEHPETEIFFITICIKDREKATLTRNDIPLRLLDSIRFYHQHGKWSSLLALIMPDHLHLAAGFPGELKSIIQTWKRWTSRNLDIQWQRDFFDHRLRSEEKWKETADYILQNPVRAGLVKNPRDWPHLWIPCQR